MTKIQAGIIQIDAEILEIQTEINSLPKTLEVQIVAGIVNQAVKKAKAFDPVIKSLFPKKNVTPTNDTAENDETMV